MKDKAALGKRQGGEEGGDSIKASQTKTQSKPDQTGVNEGKDGGISAAFIESHYVRRWMRGVMTAKGGNT